MMSSELIRQMIEQNSYPVLTESTLEAFLKLNEHSVLFFTEDPKQYPESNDVAVILPELATYFKGRFQVAVIDREVEHRLHRRFPFDSWPALVFMQRGNYLGAITRVQDWLDYLREIERLLNAAPLHIRDVGFPVVPSLATAPQ
ncbi:MAG: hydrogenase-1 expression HyaE [Sedimenticola sp.]|nr:hydrogenase-1 expression HyaE [Sedimenticola sp.]